MPIRRKRLHTGHKVRIIDSTSSYFRETGTLEEPRYVPVGMKLENRWLVKLDSTGAKEVFAPEQLEVIE